MLLGFARLAVTHADAQAMGPDSAAIKKTPQLRTVQNDFAVPGLPPIIGPGQRVPAAAGVKRPAGAAQVPSAPQPTGARAPDARPMPGLPAQGTMAQAPAGPAHCDTSCVRRFADFAAQSCVPLIEAKAPLDYDWLSRPLGGLFTQAEQPGKDNIIRYRGDAVRVLTPQNQWLRHAYECAFDPVARKIVGVQLRPGRLVPPAEIARLANVPSAATGVEKSVTGKPSPQAQALAAALLQAGQQRAAGQPLTPQPVAAILAPRPKPRLKPYEPDPIRIVQAHRRDRQIDTDLRLVQSDSSGY